ncbi:hypothetical protein [Ruficoccus sp. ZRK36]|uniref:hypothetical protein n=1 Tax=Ruficoccus sp. ZRK36 TaxID=2866311 RepID=UPI001C72A971|nr:hypothetical protein [Ruficoccus sp. ZRK36]QYY37404.1 hypothetical protein K0V07_07940 [Ruficoccus sp. ZRK36]
MKNKALTLALFSCVVCTAGFGQWTSQLSDNFDSYSFGDQPGGYWYNSSATTDTGANSLVTNQDGGTSSTNVTLPANNLGGGNALYFFDTSGGATRAAMNVSSTGSNFDVVRVSFDFSLPTIVSGTSTFGVITLTSADNTNFSSSSDRAVSISVKNDGQLVWSGGSHTLSNPSSAHSLSIVANGTDADYSYAALDGSGTSTISSYSFDLYVDDALIKTSIAFSTDSVELGRFGFTTFGGAQGDFMIDNLEMYSAAIPEASTMMLLALSLGVLPMALRYRARRKSRTN